MSIKKNVVDFLKSNPTATHKDCSDAGLKVSESHFSRIRKSYQKSDQKNKRVMAKVPEKRTYNRIDYTLVDQFLCQNPNGSHSQFKKEYPDFEISDAGFYGRRRNGNSGNENSSPAKAVLNRPSLYMTLWSYPTEKLNSETQEAINNLVETLNKSRRTNWQIIELKNPAVVEIREISRR